MKFTRHLLTSLCLAAFALVTALHRAQAQGTGDSAQREILRRLDRLEAENRAQQAELRASKEREAALRGKLTALEAAAAPGKNAEEKPKEPGSAAEAQSMAAFEKLQNDPWKLFTTPDSPAAAVLGLAPEKVIHADTPKQLIMSTINGLDDKGHFQTGFAVDFAPAQLFEDQMKRRETTAAAAGRDGKMSWTLADYWRQVANRTQVSFAAIRGTETEDQSSKLALGVNVTLMDAEDPLVSGRLKFRPHVSGREFAYEDRGNALNPEFVEDTPFPDEGFGKIMNILHRHASWSVGGAFTWLSAEEDDEDYEYTGATAWSTFTFSFAKPKGSGKAGASDAPVDEHGLYPKAPYRLLLHARYDDQQSIVAGDAVNPPQAGVDPVTGAPIPAPAFVDQDSLLAVGAFRLGRRDFNATGSIAYVKRWQRSGGSGEEDSLIYSVSAEKRIGEGPMWVTLSAGQEVGGVNDGNTIILGGLRLGFGPGSFGNADAPAP